jgi:hypothetical protein
MKRKSAGGFIRQLEGALALSEELNDGMIGYLNGTPQLFGVVFRRVVGGRNCCARVRVSRCASKNHEGPLTALIVSPRHVGEQVGNYRCRRCPCAVGGRHARHGQKPSGAVTQPITREGRNHPPRQGIFLSSERLPGVLTFHLDHSAGADQCAQRVTTGDVPGFATKSK